MNTLHDSIVLQLGVSDTAEKKINISHKHDIKTILNVRMFLTFKKKYSDTKLTNRFNQNKFA